jgi:hypothetical protein
VKKMVEMIAGRAQGASRRNLLDTKPYFDSNEAYEDFQAIPRPSGFVKHNFKVLSIMAGIPDGATLNWEIKNLTKDQVIVYGTGVFIGSYDFGTYSGGDTIRARMWLSSGNFAVAGIAVSNHTHYNE